MDSPTGNLGAESSNMAATCTLCQRLLSSDYDSGDLESINICGDCKFLLLEDLETPIHYARRRRISRVRRTRFGSSESIEDIFAQRFSHMINLARLNQPNVAENESQQRSSSHTTPSNSRRWRRVVSDTESDGFDSLYGGESDIVSYSASYGGDSDASVDGHSLLDTETFAHVDGESDFDSDSDIDPMHAGLNQWNLDDDDDEEEEDNEFEGTVRWRVRGGRLTTLDGNSGDYLDARGLRDLLEQLAEAADASRQGAPPAAASYVNTLPRVVINDEHVKKQGDLACAICKDCLCVGTIVNELPCSHLYHPSCILPWLSARNSCPLCRYELPTDDLDYEERKQHNGNNSNNNNTGNNEIEQEGDSSEDSSSSYDVRESELGNIDGDGAADRPSRSRFSFLAAAAPIVSIAGIALVLWLGNSVTARSRQQRSGRSTVIEGSGNCLPNNQREGNRSRRWWSLF